MVSERSQRRRNRDRQKAEAESRRQEEEEARRQQANEEEAEHERQGEEEAHRQQVAEEEAKSRRQEEEEARRQQADEEEAERRRQEEQLRHQSAGSYGYVSPTSSEGSPLLGRYFVSTPSPAKQTDITTPSPANQTDISTRSTAKQVDYNSSLDSLTYSLSPSPIKGARLSPQLRTVHDDEETKEAVLKSSGDKEHEKSCNEKNRNRHDEKLSPTLLTVGTEDNDAVDTNDAIAPADSQRSLHPSLSDDGDDAGRIEDEGDDGTNSKVEHATENQEQDPGRIACSDIDDVVVDKSGKQFGLAVGTTNCQEDDRQFIDGLRIRPRTTIRGDVTGMTIVQNGSSACVLYVKRGVVYCHCTSNECSVNSKLDGINDKITTIQGEGKNLLVVGETTAYIFKYKEGMLFEDLFHFPLKSFERLAFRWDGGQLLGFKSNLTEESEPKTTLDFLDFEGLVCTDEPAVSRSASLPGKPEDVIIASGPGHGGYFILGFLNEEGKKWKYYAPICGCEAREVVSSDNRIIVEAAFNSTHGYMYMLIGEKRCILSASISSHESRFHEDFSDHNNLTCGETFCLATSPSKSEAFVFRGIVRLQDLEFDSDYFELPVVGIPFSCASKNFVAFLVELESSSDPVGTIDEEANEDNISIDHDATDGTVEVKAGSGSTDIVKDDRQNATVSGTGTDLHDSSVRQTEADEPDLSPLFAPITQIDPQDLGDRPRPVIDPDLGPDGDFHILREKLNRLSKDTVISSPQPTPIMPEARDNNYGDNTDYTIISSPQPTPIMPEARDNNYGDNTDYTIISSPQPTPIMPESTRNDIPLSQSHGDSFEADHDNEDGEYDDNDDDDSEEELSVENDSSLGALDTIQQSINRRAILSGIPPTTRLEVNISTDLGLSESQRGDIVVQFDEERFVVEAGDDLIQPYSENMRFTRLDARRAAQETTGTTNVVSMTITSKSLRPQTSVLHTTSRPTLSVVLARKNDPNWRRADRSVVFDLDIDPSNLLHSVSSDVSEESFTRTLTQSNTASTSTAVRDSNQRIWHSDEDAEKISDDENAREDEDVEHCDSSDAEHCDKDDEYHYHADDESEEDLANSASAVNTLRGINDRNIDRIPHSESDDVEDGLENVDSGNIDDDDGSIADLAVQQPRAAQSRVSLHVDTGINVEPPPVMLRSPRALPRSPRQYNDDAPVATSQAEYQPGRFIPKNAVEMFPDYVIRVASILTIHYGNDIHKVPTSSWRSAFNLHVHEDNLDQCIFLLIEIIKYVIQKIGYFDENTPKHRMGFLDYLWRVKNSNMVFYFVGTNGCKITSVQSTDRMSSKELAAMIVSLYFQCPGFARKTIDPVTGSDSGLRFDREREADERWVQRNPKHEPKPIYITPDIARIMYGNDANLDLIQTEETYKDKPEQMEDADRYRRKRISSMLSALRKKTKTKMPSEQQREADDV